MTENAAPAAPAKLRKFPCEACGADVVWNPGAASLKCPYCGAERHFPRTTGEVLEHPIEEALSGAHDLGWGMARKAVTCRGCGATTTFAAGVAASRCAFCGAPSVVEAPANEAMVRPEGLLPFRVDRDGAAGKFRQWLTGLWFRPNDLSQKSALSELQGVYVPFWTFDAATHSAWKAEAGYDYQVAVQVGERPAGDAVRDADTVGAGRGVLEHDFFDDVPVSASKGLPSDLAALDRALSHPRPGFRTSRRTSRASSPRSTRSARRTRFLAKERMARKSRPRAAGRSRATRYRNLNVRTAWSAVTYKNALLPVWIAAYQYAGKPYRFLVNGVTGQVEARRRGRGSRSRSQSRRCPPLHHPRLDRQDPKQLPGGITPA